MKIFTFLFIFLFLTLSISLPLMVENVKAEDTYNGHLQYTVSSNSGTLTDYQVKVIFINDSLDSSGNIIYVNNMVQSDFRDIYFEDEEGEAIPFCRTTYNEDEWAIYWVKMPTITEEDNTLNVYYGSATAEYKGNGNETFIEFCSFDDCCDEDYGNSWSDFDCNDTYASRLFFAGQTDEGWPHTGENRWNRRYINLEDTADGEGLSVGVSISHEGAVYDYQDNDMYFWFGLSDDNRTNAETSFNEKFLGTKMNCEENNGSAYLRGVYYDETTLYESTQYKYIDLHYFWEIETSIYDDNFKTVLQNGSSNYTSTTDISASTPPDYDFFVFGWRETLDGGPLMDRPYHSGLLDSIYTRQYVYPEPTLTLTYSFEVDFEWTIVEQNYTEYGFTYHIVNFTDITNTTGLTIDNWIWDLGNGEVISGIFPNFKNVSTRYEQEWNTSLYNESERKINVTLTLCNFTIEYEQSKTEQISLPRINPSTDYIDFSWMNLLPVVAVIILILLLVAVVIKLVGGVI